MAKALEISIIITVYNAEKYLGYCVKSVLDSLGKIPGEILLVDNNSTDKSLEIIKNLKRQHKEKIGVLQCSTPGASPNRNLGVKNAKGKYIWFIDADDYIDTSAIPKLLEKAKEKDSDIVMMGALRLNSDNTTTYFSAVDAKDKNYKSRFIRYGMGPWQVIIRRKWWNDCGFFFKEGVIHEDMELMSALILDTDKFSSIDEPLYYYRSTPGSVLHREEFSPHIFDIFPDLESLYERFKKHGAEKKYHAELEWFFIWNLLIDAAKDFAKFPEGKPGFKRTREMLNEYFPNWRKNKFLRQKPLKLQLLVRLNYYK